MSELNKATPITRIYDPELAAELNTDDLSDEAVEAIMDALTETVATITVPCVCTYTGEIQRPYDPELARELNEDLE